MQLCKSVNILSLLFDSKIFFNQRLLRKNKEKEIVYIAEIFLPSFCRSFSLTSTESHFLKFLFVVVRGLFCFEHNKADGFHCSLAMGHHNRKISLQKMFWIANTFHLDMTVHPWHQLHQKLNDSLLVLLPL